MVVNLLDENQSSNVNKLSHQNYNLILNSTLVSLVEICSGFDNKKLTQFLKLLNEYSKKVLAKQKITEEMKFSLKIRKIKRTNKKGLYIVNQNSILIDPRHVDSFLHELGHWYHTWFRKDISEEQQEEEFARNFKL